MKLSTPKGTRDFSPAEVERRNYIFDTIRSVFRLYGYRPIETPAMENLETLTGKYGEEGDRLIFKIFPRGERLVEWMNLKGERPRVINEALRYDLTVPFARYVVQHRNDITFPFRRFQVQPVWRADRPQKGRYREFWQCDADVIGSDSLLNEVEMALIISEVFGRLKIPVNIRMNNRKILQGFAEFVGEKDRMTEITVAIDKLEKIGFDGVINALKDKGFSASAVEQIGSLIKSISEQEQSSNDARITHIGALLAKSETGMKGVEEMRFIMDVLNNFKPQTTNFQPDLARGLNYYTGAIFEVTTDNFAGSLCGGGRYDDLTGIFGMPGVSGVGISFGADRIYDVMEQNGLFPPESASGTRLLFVNFGEAEEKHCLSLVQQLRAAGISAELYPDRVKLKKQMHYADACKIPYVALVGADELASGKITVKDMAGGDQRTVTMDELIKTLS